MFKTPFLTLMLVAPLASAQDIPTPAQSRAPTVENVKRPSIDPKFCVYEDKKYSEGAIKKVDGVTMICLAEDGVVFSSQQQQDLEWVYGDSLRGQLYLKPATIPKR